ncbi:hypothetical protein EB796_007907 [Bugula neritina]|uniref:Uncharacterized protein n=1 Tax=Bugula neritina TaxID=10212 RepID=A0A7J7K571_BUGNE|nr:hypothetical protein EB796_007907 [Bugula neritina]
MSFKIFCGILLLPMVVFSQPSYIVELREEVLFDLSSSDNTTLQAAVDAQTAELLAALDAMTPIDAVCDDIKDVANASCSSCVKQKCKDKKDSCPSLVSFFTDDVPNFFVSHSNSVAGAVTNQYSTAVSGTQNVINIIGSDLRDGLNGAAGVANIAKEQFTEAINTALNFATNTGKQVISFGADAIDTLENAANFVGNLITGKRKRSLTYLTKRTATTTASPLPSSPPSCNDLRMNNDKCGYYANPSICSDCDFDAEVSCPGWKDANDALEVERVDAAWIEDIVTDNSFVIVKCLYDRYNYDFISGKFTNTNVTVALFGNIYNFIVAEGLDLIGADAESASTVIRYSIAAAKLAKKNGSA